MKIENKSSGLVTVTLSMDEVLTINNALNEVCNALHLDEFETRMGATIEETRELLGEINKLFENEPGGDER